jgi:hypothetical protein
VQATLPSFWRLLPEWRDFGGFAGFQSIAESTAQDWTLVGAQQQGRQNPQPTSLLSDKLVVLCGNLIPDARAGRVHGFDLLRR